MSGTLSISGMRLMSEKLTLIRLPGQRDFNGFQDWGVRSVSHMLDYIERHKADLRKELASLEAAKPEDFRVSVILGPHLQRHVETLQEGRPG